MKGKKKIGKGIKNKSEQTILKQFFYLYVRYVY